MKKYFYMSLVLLYLLSAAVFFCGCSSSGDGLVLDISSEGKDARTNQTASDEDTSSDVAEVSVLEQGTQMAYVYICGAVELPGVYSLKAGSRLYEAVEMAGGLAADADDTCLNMARQVIDGEQVVVLTQAEMAEIRASGVGAAGMNAGAQAAMEVDDGLVNINTADKAQLTTVSGIGESRAQAIIDYREKNGAFKSIEDIKNVDGIKDGLFSKIKDKIKI